MLCPMHFPAFLCGIICGPWYGAIIGFISPLLRFILFTKPIIFPTGIAMAFELCAYGLISGIIWQKTKKILPSLIIGILSGRAVWGIVYWIFMGLFQVDFSLSIFISAGLINNLPGTMLQLIFIPIIVKRIKEKI